MYKQNLFLNSWSEQLESDNSFLLKMNHLCPVEKYKKYIEYSKNNLANRSLCKRYFEIKAIQELLNNHFPHPISGQKLNKYIKEVCELSGIDEVVEGKILDKDTNRKVAGQYPKYMLVTSHCFRRSFATNYYKKMATPILITITGHSKESMFLKYINRQEDKDENAKLFLQYYNQRLS